MKTAKKTRVPSYDFIRVVAMIFILAVHDAVHYLDTKNSLFPVFEALLAVGVPLFFLLSGKFAYKIDLEDKHLYKKYYLKKFVHLLIPIFVYMVIKNWHVMMYVKHIDITPLSFIRHLGISIVNGYSYMEYWFLYVLIGLLLAVPFTAHMIKNLKTKDKKAFIAVALIYTTFSMLVSQFAKVDFAVNYAFFSYPLYFFCGAFIEDLFEEKSARKKLYTAGIVGFIINAALILNGIKLGYKSFSPFYFVFAIAIFILLKNLGEKLFKKPRPVFEKSTVFIAKHSLAVYMSHVMLMHIINDPGFLPNNILGYILSVVFGVIISVLFGFIIDETVVKILQLPFKKSIDKCYNEEK